MLCSPGQGSDWYQLLDSCASQVASQTQDRCATNGGCPARHGVPLDRWMVFVRENPIIKLMIFSGRCQNTMVDQNQRIWKEARVQMPRSLLAGSTMKQFPSQAEPNMVCLNDRKWGYNQHETNHFKGNDEDIQWQDSNSLFATNFFTSVFTDHTLAHPLSCRGGVVAHLSA